MCSPLHPFHTSADVTEPRRSHTGVQQDAVQELHKMSEIFDAQQTRALSVVQTAKLTTMGPPSIAKK